MKKKQYRPGRLLGEFLVKNRVLTAAQLGQAIEFQKKVNLNLGIMSWTELLVRQDDLERVLERLNQVDSFEEAVMQLGLLTPEELEEIRREKKEFRVPLGVVLQKLNLITAEKFKVWLERFEKQKFDVTGLKDQLKKTPLFASLPDTALRKVVAGMKYKFFYAGDFVYQADDPGQGIFLVESGLIRLMVKMKREQRVLGSRHNGDTFGLAAALTETSRQESALAIMDTVLWRLDGKVFRDLVQKYPRLAVTATEQLSELIQTSLTEVRGTSSQGESKISIVILDHDAHGDGLGNGLIAGLETFLPAPALIVNTISGIKPARGRNPARTTLSKTRPMELKRPGVFYLYLSDIESARELNTLSVWLRRQSEKYESIVFVVSRGEVLFRRFIMGLCRRSATVIRGDMPEFIRYLKPGRDRLYLAEGESRKKSLARHLALSGEFPRVLIPNLISADDRLGDAYRIARWLGGKSVGIAFGGGGARALAHIGVLEILERIGLQVDMICGASAGAHVGGMLANGATYAEILDFFTRELVEQKSHPFNDLTWPKKSLIRGKKYFKVLRDSFGDLKLPETKIPFFPVATDLRTGREILVRDIAMNEAVLASGSAPGIFPPVSYRDKFLLDGGMVNNIPASVLKQWETDFVLSINISIEPARAPLNPEALSSIFLQALDIFVDNTLRDHMNYTDFEIKPQVDEFSVTDHPRGRDIIQAGRLAAERNLSRLLRTLHARGIPLQSSPEPNRTST